MTTVASVHPVLPPHRYPQSEITAAFSRARGLSGTEAETVHRLHRHTRVDQRHLALPLERYADLGDFTAANDEFLRSASDLAAEAISGALRAAGIRPDEVDAIVSTTVTGIAVPSLEARIAGRVGLRPDVVRLPLFGLGCVGGVAGLARTHDYLVGHPDQVAVLLSVELCSLTLQQQDASIANAVATGLFGDGAAAVVAIGADRADRRGVTGPAVRATRSHLLPDSVRVMGWDVGQGGFHIVLDAGIPALVGGFLREDVEQFLADHGLDRSAVDRWITHPGGPKVIDAVEAALGLEPPALDLTRRSLAAAGNMSSASVLHVLADTWREQPPTGDGAAVMIAMGPGFCAELVLLQW